VIMTGKSHVSGTDRIAEAAQVVGLEHEDIIINIQGDQPIFDPDVVSQMIDPLENDHGVFMSTLKHRITEQHNIMNPNHVKVVTDSQDFALYFSRHPIPYYRDSESSVEYYKHLGFYGYRMEFLIRFTRLPEGMLESAEKLEQLRALEHGFKIRVVETSFDSVEVDVPEDVKRVEEIIQNLNLDK